jgi:amino acid adenylation domain-containing protein
MKFVPLPVAQQGLWFLSQSDPRAAAAYNMVFVFKHATPLDIGLLHRSLRIMSSRHDQLRMAVEPRNGIPNAAIPDAGQAASVAISTASGTIEDCVREHHSQGFDLSVGPLVRVTIARPEDDDAAQGAIIFSFPHLIFDGPSADIFFAELAQISGRLAAGSMPVFETQPIDLHTLLQHETSFVNSEAGREVLRDTVARLAGIPDRLELPRNRVAAGGRSASPCAIAEFQLESSVVQRVRSYCASHRVTSASVYLAAYELLLWRYSNQRSFGIVVPVSNRELAGADRTIGYLTNLGVVACHVDPMQRIAGFITSVQSELFDVLECRELPFPLVAKGGKRIGKNLQGPFLQIGFGHAWASGTTCSIGDCELQAVDFSPRYSKNELKLDLQESRDAVRCWLIYDCEGFERELIEGMIGHFHGILEEILSNGDRRLHDISLLTRVERQRLLVGWNNTARDYPREQTLPRLFEAQARRAPHRVAVMFGEEELTYGELNTRSNQLAHYLRAQGVGPDVLVGLCLERSMELVIGLLGILKAGGAYVPLDPSYPAERLAYMLVDAAPAVLLTQSRLMTHLRAPPTQCFCFDRDAHLLQSAAECDAGQSSGPHHLAYVIYTSGSTGRPKGVPVAHTAVVNVLHAMGERLEIGSEDVVLNVTSMSFDIAALEIFLPLIGGARLVLCPPAAAGDARALAALIERRGVSHAQATPAAWRLLLDHAAPMKRDLKILCGGEALSADLARRLLEHTATLWNVYGPTETTIWSACHRVKNGDDTPALGRPIANTTMYILDEHLDPVPIGVAGELHIGGAGLARGYLNRPDLTAERFVPNPFEPQGARMYRTGDLARYLPDGNIVYLGRLDQQVKIRGFRIELGEIESALRGLPEIRDAVVIVREPKPDDKRLVAYLVAEEGVPQLEINSLRAALARSLPDYMLPGQMVLLSQLPLTPNGKLDRKALPAPEESSLTAAYVAPSSDAERYLVRLWAELLGMSAGRIGVNDDFFVLGGHSLLSVQMVSRINKEFGTTLSTYAAFESKTVAALAAAVRNNAGSSLGRETLKPVELPDGVEPTYPQLAMMRDPSGVAFNMCRAMWIGGMLDANALRRSFSGLLARQDALRAFFVVGVSGVRMRVTSTVPDVLCVMNWENDEQRSIERRISLEIDKESRLPFNLREGPLVRALLIRITAEKHVLIFSVHHVVSDMWSIDIIKKDLAALYAAELDASRARPPALPIRYVDFVHWQRQLRDTPEFQRQLEYWAGEFAGLAAQGKFPIKPERTAGSKAVSGCIELAPTVDWQRRLKEFAARRGMTPYVVLVAALHLALADYSGLEQQMVWTPISRRTQLELEDSVGLYTNLIVVAERVKQELTATDFLARIERKVLRGHANGDVSALAVVMKDPAARPALPVVGLNFVASDGGDWGLTGTVVTPIEINTEAVALVTALEVGVLAGPQSMTVIVYYDTAIFNAVGVRQIAKRMMEAADGLMSSQTLRLADIMQSWHEEADAVPCLVEHSQ